MAHTLKASQARTETQQASQVCDNLVRCYTVPACMNTFKQQGYVMDIGEDALLTIILQLHHAVPC